MREFILEQIEKREKGQLNEIDLSSMMGKLKGLVTSKDAQANKDFAEIISKKFQGDFSKYLNKSLIKTGKRTNGIGIVVKYLKDSSEENYDNLFELIGFPMLEYFVGKLFGKNSMSGRMTPFMKKISTGNSELDSHIFNALEDALEHKRVRHAFREKLRSTLNDKMSAVINDQEFYDLINSSETKTEGLDEANIFHKIGDKVSDMFSSNGSRSKFRVIDHLIDHMPNLNSRLKKDIAKEFYKLSYNEILDLKRAKNFDKAAKVVTIPIMQHIIKNSQELYFDKNSFGELVKIAKDVFLDKQVVLEVHKGVKQFLRTMVYRAREKELDKKRKRRR